MTFPPTQFQFNALFSAAVWFHLRFHNEILIIHDFVAATLSALCKKNTFVKVDFFDSLLPNVIFNVQVFLFFIS